MNTIPPFGNQNGGRNGSGRFFTDWNGDRMIVNRTPNPNSTVESSRQRTVPTVKRIGQRNMGTVVYEFIDSIGVMCKDNVLETLCGIAYIIFVIGGQNSGLFNLLSYIYQQVVCCFPLHQWFGPILLVVMPPKVTCPLYLGTIIKLVRQWLVKPNFNRFWVFLVIGVIIWFCYFSTVTIIGFGLTWKGLINASCLYAIVCFMNYGNARIGFWMAIPVALIAIVTSTPEDIRAELAMKSFGAADWDTSVILETTMGCQDADCKGTSKSRVLAAGHPYAEKCKANLIDCVAAWHQPIKATPSTVRPNWAPGPNDRLSTTRRPEPAGTRQTVAPKVELNKN